MADNTLVTPKEVADFFSVSPRTIQRWAKTGKMPSIKIGGSYRFSGKVLALETYNVVPS